MLDHQPNPMLVAPCWVVLSNDDKHAFVTNSLSGSIARVRIRPDGKVTILGATRTTNGAALDEDSSRDGHYPSSC